MALEHLISYLRQPSTYQGLANISAALGFAAFPQYWPLIVSGLGILHGAIQVIRNDDPNIAEVKRRQLAARAEQLGMTIVPKDKPQL